MHHSTIIYNRELTLHANEFIDVLKRSTLGQRRPINDKERIQAMCQGANIIVTARLDGKLIGVARAISDMVYCTYLSDLAVDEAYQKMGIGTRLIAETKLQAPDANFILLSAPAAVGIILK